MIKSLEKELIEKMLEKALNKAKEKVSEVKEKVLDETAEKIAIKTEKKIEELLEKKTRATYPMRETENVTANEHEKGFTGGRFDDIPIVDGRERHHIPADVVSPLERGDGPCIQMESEDHRKTESYGNSKEAIAYRNKQKELIDAGKFLDAIEMDVKDIELKFGNKYDDAIKEARAYIEKIEAEGKI